MIGVPIDDFVARNDKPAGRRRHCERCNRGLIM